MCTGGSAVAVIIASYPLKIGLRNAFRFIHQQYVIWREPKNVFVNA